MQLSIYQNDKLQKKENEGCMRVEAIPMHGVVSMKTVTKETIGKILSGTSLDEEMGTRAKLKHKIKC